MLRVRFRQWGINHKNKRSVRAHSTLLAASSTVGRSRAANVLSTQLERPVTTSPEDVRQRQFLKAMDDYLEHAWQLELDLYEGRDIVLALNLGWEMEVAATSSSKCAWSALKKAASTLQEQNFNRISPCMLVSLLTNALSWGEPENSMEEQIRKNFCNYLLSLFGALHPVVIAVVFAIQNKLDLSTCQGILRISDAKSHANSTTTEQKELIAEWSRESYIEILWFYGFRVWRTSSTHGRPLVSTRNATSPSILLESGIINAASMRRSTFT
jgi:hypothetical protein